MTKDLIKKLEKSISIRVACIICKNIFPVNEGMVDMDEKGWQHCWCMFCKKGTDIKTLLYQSNEINIE